MIELFFFNLLFSNQKEKRIRTSTMSSTNNIHCVVQKEEREKFRKREIVQLQISDR